MNAKELLEIHIKNMKTSQENMNFMINDVNERIIEAVNDTSMKGKLSKKDRIIQLLEHEHYCLAKKSAYDQMQTWAESRLVELNNKPEQAKPTEKVANISLESLLQIESVLAFAETMIDQNNEVQDLLLNASNTVSSLMTEHFTEDEITIAQESNEVD